MIDEFLKHDALIQLPECPDKEIAERLAAAVAQLLDDHDLRRRIATNAADVMTKNRGATQKTVEYLKEMLGGQGGK